MDQSDHRDLSDPGAALLDLFAWGAELTRLFVDEAESPRGRLAKEPGPTRDCEDQAAEPTLQRPSEGRSLELPGENLNLLDRLRTAGATGEKWAARHAGTERCHDDLVHLFVASEQLHSSRSGDEVVAAISEIVINLIGGEGFVLHSKRGEGEGLIAVAGEGRAVGAFPAVAEGEGVVGEAVALVQQPSWTAPRTRRHALDRITN